VDRIDLHPREARHGVSVRFARLTASGLVTDPKGAIAAFGALAQVSRLDLFGVPLARPEGLPAPNGWEFFH